VADQKNDSLSKGLHETIKGGALPLPVHQKEPPPELGPNTRLGGHRATDAGVHHARSRHDLHAPERNGRNFLYDCEDA
jgi:hypothetical protein